MRAYPAKYPHDCFPDCDLSDFHRAGALQDYQLDESIADTIVQLFCSHTGGLMVSVRDAPCSTSKNSL